MSASHALLTGKNSGRRKEKVFFQCSSHKSFRFCWFKNEFLASHQRCFQIRASAFNADLSTEMDPSTGNPNAVLANRIIRCIFTLHNKIIRCIYLCSCVLESFWKGFESDQRRLTLLVSKCVCLSSLWIIRFSSLFAAGDVSCWGTSATQWQKFHTDDQNLSAIWSEALIGQQSSYIVLAIVYEWQTKDKRPHRSNVNTKSL